MQVALCAPLTNYRLMVIVHSVALIYSNIGTLFPKIGRL